MMLGATLLERITSMLMVLVTRSPSLILVIASLVLIVTAIVGLLASSIRLTRVLTEF